MVNWRSADGPPASTMHERGRRFERRIREAGRTTSATRPSAPFDVATRQYAAAAHLQHQHSDRWLHARQGRMFVGQRKDPFAHCPRAGLRPDQPQPARTRPVVATRTRSPQKMVTSFILELPTVVHRRKFQPDHRRLDHGEHAPGSPVVGQRRPPATANVPKQWRFVGSGVPSQHAAGQRIDHRPEGQGQVQQFRAEQRCPVR